MKNTCVEVRPQKSETAAKAVFGFAAVFSVIAVFAIIFFIFYASVPAFREIGVFNFLFGRLWAPDKEFLPVSGRFGILPMIVGSLCVTAGAVLLGGGSGVFTAMFMSKFCPAKLKGVLGHLINFLAGIPSIIYGFFGITILIPVMDRISPTGSGMGILASSVILGVMILPTVTSITKDSLDAVPREIFEGALALGASKEQAAFKTVLPAAKSGVLTALVLGTGRAVGETMAVLMVAGNSAAFPTSVFSNIRTLTINMVLEMAYASPGSLHRNALIATGAVLLVFILILNLLLGLLRRKKRERRSREKPLNIPDEGGAAPAKSYNFRETGTFTRLLKYLSAGITAAIVLVLTAIIGFILIKGLPAINFKFLFGPSGNAGASLRPAFVTTGMLILIALAVALPVGIGAAIYLSEYAKPDTRLVKTIRLFTETLAGMPSIIFGFFGVIFFCEFMKMGVSVLAGGLTLSLIILPTVIRSTEESIIAVPHALREASLALGAGKLRTIFKVVLPSAISGIVTSVILGIGRIVGESAALIYTAGAVVYTPDALTDRGASFAVMMWMFSSEGLYMSYAYGTAAVLLIFVAVLNTLIALLKNGFERGKKP